ncbi:thymidylate kinase-like protein [Panaeolus papilionaceus]|nr:thymidylate kinase-like protein [Panaeolus papilionaceus]
MSTSPQHRAPFIVIEGLDRSGKTTQTSNLLSRLQQSGKNVQLIKFPDRTTPIGQMIDAYLRSTSELDDHAIHLLFSANRWELASTIEKLLNSGTTVICDRYAFSGIAFSASKVDANGDRLLSYKWCKSPEIGLPKPDIVLFLDITPEKARERGGYGEERYEKEEMQRRVRSTFEEIRKEMVQLESKAGDNTLTWEVIDAGRSLEEVEGDIWSHIEPLYASQHVSLGGLWKGE